MTEEKLLQLKDVSVHYGGVQALKDVSVYINTGEIIALMGPNGAGKSTVLKTIFGIAEKESGKILWHDKEIKPIPHEIVARGISFVPQGRRVLAHLSVQENLEIGAYLEKDGNEIKRRLEEVMTIFPILRQKRKEKSGSLSGGQQQMLAIGRGLMSDPKVLLLDEPSLGLSPKVVKEVFEKIKEINDRHKTAIMIVEHNLKSLLPICHRAYVLDKGQVIKEDTGANIVSSDILEKVFMGRI